ncbi:MAG: WbqC family protein [Bdellovibrionota bacterium]
MKLRPTVAIIQPSFVPWRGYFAIMAKCDYFIFLDDVQFDRRGWRNRNMIKTSNGVQWITVPVESKGKYHQRISDVQICKDQPWVRKLLRSVEQAYCKTPHFKYYFSWLESCLTCRWHLLADLDIQLTKDIAKFLGLRASFLRSSEIPSEGSLDKVERLVELCKFAGATQYISGPSAVGYLSSSSAFEQANIEVRFVEYNFRPYPQQFGSFVSEVSVIDALFNASDKSQDWLEGITLLPNALSAGRNSNSDVDLR